MMKKIILTNPAERNFYGISKETAERIVAANSTLEFDEESGKYTEFDANGNDIETYNMYRVGLGYGETVSDVSEFQTVDDVLAVSAEEAAKIVFNGLEPADEPNAFFQVRETGGGEYSYFSFSQEAKCRPFEIGKEYRFGEIWDGDGGDEEGERLLQEGTVSPDNKHIIAFSVVTPSEYILNNIVRVTDIY